MMCHKNKIIMTTNVNLCDQQQRMTEIKDILYMYEDPTPTRTYLLDRNAM